MEDRDLKEVVETLLFITDQPIGVAKICEAVGEKDPGRVTALLGDIRREYEERRAPLQIMEIAEGFQMATRPAFARFVRALYRDKMTMRLSTAALETLSIIAYRQPITRAEVEEIRGVEVIAALETLLEKGLVRVVGRKESVGRPLLYGTTVDFLRQFGLRSLEDMPPLDVLAPGPRPEAAGPESALEIPSASAPPAEPVPAEASKEEAPLSSEQMGRSAGADAAPDREENGGAAEPA